MKPHKLRNRKVVTEGALLRLLDVMVALDKLDELTAILDRFPEHARKRRWAAMMNVINRGFHAKIKPHRWTA